MNSERINTPELIDLGPSFYTPLEYQNCLVQLGRIGRFLGGDQATLWAFNQLKNPPTSILDVGCGGGNLAILLAKKFPTCHLKGIDLSAEAIHFANNQLALEPTLHSVEFSIPASAQLNEPAKSFDVVTSTLVCHHLLDKEIIDLLKRSVEVAREAVIINDLHRHFLAYWSFFAISPLCFPNRLIFHDGLLSIKRAFKRKDWQTYLAAAGIPQEAYSLTWHCLFRWILIIYPRKIQ